MELCSEGLLCSCDIVEFYSICVVLFLAVILYALCSGVCVSLARWCYVGLMLEYLSVWSWTLCICWWWYCACMVEALYCLMLAVLWICGEGIGDGMLWVCLRKESEAGGMAQTWTKVDSFLWRWLGSTLRRVGMEQMEVYERRWRIDRFLRRRIDRFLRI